MSTPNIEAIQVELNLLKHKVEQMEKALPVSEWLSAEKAAEFLNVELSYMYELSSKREITKTRRGGLKFKVSSMMEWLRNGQVKSHIELSREVKIRQLKT